MKNVMAKMWQKHLRLITAVFMGILQFTQALEFGAPSDVTVYNKTANTLQIQWEDVEGDILGYRVRHRLNETSTTSINGSFSNNSSLFVCKNKTSVQLEDLEVYTEYLVEVRAFNNSTFGQNRTVRVFRTDEGVPTSPPIEVMPNADNATMITVTWDQVPEDHRRGKIIAYLVTVIELRSGNEVVNKTAYNVTSLKTTIPDLNPYTFYNITVSAWTSKGVSNASAMQQIRTKEDAPYDPPINVTVHYDPYNLNDTFLFTWQKVEGRLNGILRGYEVRWKSVNAATYNKKIINTTSSKSNSKKRRRKRSADDPTIVREIKLTNLSVYTNYSLEVAAITVRVGTYSDKKYFMSQEGVPTSPPGNVTAYNTSSRSIFVTWTRPNESTIHGVLQGYEITFIPAEKNASAIRRAMRCQANTSFELTGLSVYTLYNITVAAFTIKGIGNQSDMIQAWTDEERPGAAPENVIADSKTFSSIYVSWDPVPEERRHGIIIQYEVRVQYENNGALVSKTHVQTKNRAVEIINLTMFVNYSISVRAYTRIGPGNYSSPVANTTLETAPTVVPFNVSGNATRRSILLTWDIEGPQPGFVIRRYVISYSKIGDDGTTGTATIINSTSITEKMENITGLEVYTTYEIKIAAATIQYKGNFSNPINVTTREAAPQAPPENVTAVAVNGSSIRLSWSPVPKDKRNGIITEYEVLVENRNGSVVRNVFVCGNSSTVVIGRLDMFVTYFFNVSAHTRAGPGPSSDPVNETTEQTVPDVVLDVNATAMTNSSIIVQWTVQSIPSQLNLHGFRIWYCAWRHNGEELDNKCLNNSCNEINITETTLYEDLTNLRSGTKYQIEVKATNLTAKDGTVVKYPDADFSEPINGTTFEGAPTGPPLNVAANPHSTTSINVTWHEVDECHRNGKITGYEVEVYNSSDHKIHSFNVNGSTYSEIVPNLVFANYSARVRALVSGKGGPFSQLQNTTPHQPAPDVVPQIFSAEATGNSTILVKWNCTDIPLNVGFQGYSVKYERVKYDPVNPPPLKRVDRQPCETTITNLRPYTAYRISVAARTTQDGNYSRVLFATTREGVPTAAPSNIRTETLVSSSVIIRWGPVPTDKHNGEIRGYHIVYYPEDNPTYVLTKTIRNEEFSALTLSSLGKFKTYHFKVLAYTKAGNGTPGRGTFQTSEDVPSRAPRNLTAINYVSPHEIKVTWEPVLKEYMNGQLVDYHVKYQRVRVGAVPKDYEPVKEMTVSNNITSVTLKDLDPYSEYKITVAARTSKGLGPTAQFVYAETCHCEQHLTTSWRRYEPYVNFTDDNKPAEIIPLVLEKMVQDCCGRCDYYNKITLDFKTNGRNQPSERNSSRDLLEHIDDNTDFTFPVYGHKEQDSYKGGYGFAPVIESAGVAFIVYPDITTNQNTLFRSMLLCLPVLVLPIITAYIAGIIIWCLERTTNPHDFPPSFLLGTWEGIWWSFVSMTTLGYGDRAPLGSKGRVFAIAWVLFGLVIIALTMAMITTALTSISLKSDTKLYGSKVAAEFNSPEYNVGMRRNAKFDPDKEYHSIDEVAEALMNREVEGILVDTYYAGLRSDLFNRPQLKVNQIIDYQTAYGVVLSPKSTRLGKCFHRYIISHRAEIFKMIKGKAKPIETSGPAETPQEEVSGGLLDSGSPTFLKALKYACVMLGVALFFSLIYECIRRIRSREKVQQKVNFKITLQEEMKSLVEEFNKRVIEIKIKLREKHLKQIIKYWKLQRKSMKDCGNEDEWLRISTASPHNGELTISEI